MKRFILFPILSILFLNATAQEVTPKKAAELATTFFSRKCPHKALLISDTSRMLSGGKPMLYIFNFGGGGYVVTSADERMEPVFAWSESGNITPGNLPPNLGWWLTSTAHKIENTLTYRSMHQFSDSWQSRPENKQGTQEKSVMPLCNTKWDQGCFYNALCPADVYGPCQHAVTGCVATAMAQVMKRWNYPHFGKDTHSYQHLIYGHLSADFGNTAYAWALMNDSLSSANAAVATLMYHCGVSCNMEYGSTSSSSYISHKPLTRFFRYSLNAITLYSSSFDSLAWKARLRKELDGGRPVIYSGMPQPPIPAGHAWVCDGYDAAGFFHFNWGWSGNGDGYFRMGNFAFPLDNMAVVNVMPVQNCDIAVKASVSPAGATFTGPQTIKIRIANYDTLAVSGIPLSYRVDQGMVVNDTLRFSIPPQTDTLFTFASPFDFSTIPGHTWQVQVFSAYPCDAFRENDTLVFGVENVLCSEVPYSMGFENAEPLTGWSTHDINNDGFSWLQSVAGGHNGPSCFYSVHSALQADDWLISKCITLDTGKLYRLQFWYLFANAGWQQNIEIKYGTSPSPSAMNLSLGTIQQAQDNAYHMYTEWFTVNSPGSFYVGIHNTAQPYAPSMVIDDFSLSEVADRDAGIVERISPYNGCDLGSQILTVRVRNFGNLPLLKIPMHYQQGNLAPVHDTLLGPVLPGASAVYSFSAPLVLPGGNQHIAVYCTLTGDSIHSNDSIIFNIFNHLSPLLPYSMGFESNEDYSEWTIEDENQDNYKWTVKPSGGHSGPACARYDYSSWKAADDWIISKCIMLLPGSVYRLGFWYRTEDPSWPENLAVFLGNTASPAGLTIPLIDLPGRTNATWQQALTQFSVPSAGHYYIGWKCYSDPLMFNLYIDDILLQDLTTGIQHPAEPAGWMVWPNPGTGEFMIRCISGFSEKAEWEITDLVGRTVLRGTSAEPVFEADLSNEPRGVYFLRLFMNEYQTSLKLVKR